MALLWPADLFNPGYLNNLSDRCLFTQSFMQNLVADYRSLINQVLPQTFTYPVRFNHCFARVVLDWLFQDCWYNHLHQNVPAYKQLTGAQLQAAVTRMQQWIKESQLLVEDNKASLGYRRTLREPGCV